MHAKEAAVAALEHAAALTVQASVTRAAHLTAVAGYVARARAALGPEPADRFGLEAMDHAQGEQAVVTELATRLVMTENAADRLVTFALTLTTRLPVTFTALTRGAIDEARAKVVVDETELLSDAHAAIVDESIAPALGPLTTAELRAKVKDEVEDVDREAVKRRAKKATADRHVRLKALAGGMAEMTICAPATEVVSAYNNVEALAKDKDRPGGRTDPHAGLIHDSQPPCGPDGIVLDQRGQDAHRADTALDLLRQGLGDAAPSGCGPQVFVAFPAAVGLDDQPAQLDRTGAVPAVMARELLLSHRFRPVLFDPLTGHLVAVDGHSYPAGTLPDLSRAAEDHEQRTPPLDGDHLDADQPDADQPEHPDSTAVDHPDSTAVDHPDHRDSTAVDHPDHRDSTAVERASDASTSPVDRSTASRSQIETSRPVPLPAAPTSAVTPGEEPPGPAGEAPGPDGEPSGATDEPPEPAPERRGVAASFDDDAPASELATAPGRPCPVAASGGGPYDIAAAILRFVRARSRRCTAPGCRRPSRQCDTDHRVPWPLGPTCPCNLAPLCRRHHLAKHRFGWEVRKASPDPADPSQHWTSPLGYEYVVPAEPLLPATTSAALARERGVAGETWPEDDVDPAHPYRRGGWLSTVNAREAVLALECHARAHAPLPERTSGWTGPYEDDPPF